MGQASNIIEISLPPGVQPQIDAALALRSAGRMEEALGALANPNEYNPYLYTVRGEIEFALGRFHDCGFELLRGGAFGARQRRRAIQSGALPATLGSLGCVLPSLRTGAVVRRWF